jgi:2,3-dihydroxyphenylpropionate 1,2-dioxygenase
MGQIVAAMASMHAPQLFTRPPEEDPQQLDAGIAAMRELGRRLEAARPDAVIIFGSDHMETFFLESVPTFSVISGERVNAAFAGRKWTPPVPQPLAEELLNQLVERDFDMAYSQDAVLGHSFGAILEWIYDGREFPTIPIFVNTYLPPLPRARRAAALGKAIAGIIVARTERVALIASGGMSHYPGTSHYYTPAYDFDRWCIRELENGRSDSFLNLTPWQLDEVGNTEMLPWAAVLGGIGEQHMELLSYQPTSHHGHAVVEFHSGPKPGKILPPEVYQFKNHPYHFYDHPAVSAFKLNKLLYDSRFKQQMRIRMLEDVTEVAEEYGLRSEEIEVLRKVCRLEHNRTGRPGLDADPLVGIGAHPVGALMAVHVLQAEQRRLQNAG